MNTFEKIELLSSLGDDIHNNLNSKEYNTVIEEAFEHNAWFTPDNVKIALTSIANNYLNKQKLDYWLKDNDSGVTDNIKKVGLTLAGNVPLVGLHDILCTFITNNISQIKMSSKDNTLLPFLLKKLFIINKKSESYFQEVDKLEDFDAIIATGSDNSARYFEYYFSNYPHIIRKNRNSVAIITGEESPEQIRKLGKDIFLFFGLGCRNVSKILVPEKYDFIFFLDNLSEYKYLSDHFKYSNNYNYRKSIYLLNEEPHYDNGFIVLKDEKGLDSPIGTLYYEEYKSEGDIENFVKSNSNKIQVVVSDKDHDFPVVPFGKSQEPELWDYADNIDTLYFLSKI